MNSVADFLHRQTSPEDRLLIAASGGADSSALLSLLADELELSPSRLVAGHVDHGLREDSPLDRECVQVLAKSHQTHMIWRRVDVRGASQTKHLSIEAAARALRYKALEEMADESGCQWILTAHTLDDSAETVLMRLMDGAPFYECTAIPSVRGRILRPLLSVERNDLRLYLSNNNIIYREDPSNADPHHSRNHLRQRLEGCPDFWTPESRKRLVEAGDATRQGLEVMRRLANILILGRIGTNPDPVYLAIDKIFQYFHRFGFIPIEAAWARLSGGNEGRLSSAFRRQITDCLKGSSPKAKLELPNGIKFVREGAWLALYRREPDEIEQRVFWGDNPVSSRNLILRIEKTAERGVSSDIIRAEFMDQPLFLRNIHPGDRMKLSGRPEKKVTDLLAEKNVNPIERSRTLVLADQFGPLLLENGLTAQRALPRDGDKHMAWIKWEDTNDHSTR